MSGSDATLTASRPRLAARLGAHLRDPMQRDGYALIAGSVITSGLGMVFWLVAARLYSPEQIGLASALIAAMGFLANLATLGLRNGLIRFLPVTPDPATLITRAYLWCAATAAVAAGVFLVGQPLWAPRLDILRSSPVPVVLFTSATVCWLLFVLQDAVLTGIRQARWVPVENGMYAVAKLGLLMVIVTSTPWGIFVAWAVPAAVLLVPVNVAIFRSLARARDAPAEPQKLRALIRFAAADHSSSLLWLGTTELVPLLVLALAGPASGAVYYLAFTIAYTLYLFTSNVSSAFVIEASLHPERESELMRRAILQAGRLVVPAALVGAVLAPFGLGLLGAHYEENGVTLLRLLLLSAIPQVVVGVALGRARVRQRLGVVVAVYVTVATTVVSGTVLGLQRFGLESVGWTWLSVQTFLAFVLLGGARALVRSPVQALLAAGSWVRSAPRARRRRQGAPQVVQEALRSAGLGWAESVRTLRSDNDVLVASVESGELGVVVKVATAPAGDQGLERNAAAITRIRADARSSDWDHLPTVLTSTRLDERGATVETRLPGASADRLPAVQRADAVRRAGRALAELHRLTARPTVVDEEWLRAVVDGPIEVITRLVGPGARATTLAALRDELRSMLTAGPRLVSTVHGDAWAGNIIVRTDPDEPPHVSFVDWEDSRPDGLGDVDLAHLRLAEQSGELGHAVLRALRRPERWPDAETRDGEAVLPSGLPVRGVVLLAWLGHVAAGLARSTEVEPSRWWVRRNVLHVLDGIGAQVPRPSPPPEAISAEPSGPPVPRRLQVAAVALLAVATALWTAGLWGKDPRGMTALGLVSLMDAPMIAALVLIAVGFVVAWRRQAPGPVLGAHLLVFVVLIHGTPAVFYDTLRYSWAWKHVGIVDYIIRNGSVDPGIEGVTSIYHAWPGFFAGAALLTELVGARDAVQLATWAPVAFNLTNLLALRYLVGALTSDRRVVWLTLWIFAISNWIGQDYFSPQAYAFVLHLTILGLALRYFRRRPRPTTAARTSDGWAVGCFVLLVAAVATSHQITPVMLVITLVALAVTGVLRVWPALTAMVLVVGWGLTIGLGIVHEELGSVAHDLFRPLANAEESFSKTSSVLPEQILVSWAGRGVVLLVGLLGLVGIIRTWRRHELDRAVLVLAVAPGLVPLATSFGGEVIFRVYLFALPALSLLAATAVGGRSTGVVDDGRGRRWRARLVPVGVLASSLLLISGFLFGYYGKDQQYAFTDEEVAASLWVAQVARPGTLLAVGSSNYPGQSRNYENISSVPIDREAPADVASILADPVDRLGEWLDDTRYPRSFLLLTRSQAIDVDTNGAMPPGSLQRIERVLRASGRFRVVYENRDAVVFESTRRPVMAGS